ncbi:ABC transporter ATP-binding protein [Pseudofrankia inefficax]|uniref:ABC transporter related protein n=1 Tax=Pseudofrankia inefficax (strain DSM 45817 / CECT 9037 / DDB 130130 / EuI1c) TaxID=298654 RepID=E3J420_PSEI1|nr:ABC transporter ATP-binding protein [Pseudofrankia inefficax]ADP81799.1 ABC transporter related protein [Pseudofrankia inefficax]
MTTQTTSRAPALAVVPAPAPAPAAAAGDPEGPAVRVRDVRREFGGRVVLDGIDLDIAAGEFVALLGRSGSGKSTLLRILAGLDAGATGRATVPERNAVVFQDPRLLPWARVADNVTLGLKGREARGQARDALAEVGLAGRERDWPATLSGGEAQRAALARALVRSPGLLLLDEPFGALDALTRIRMHRLLRDLCRRHRPAVLLVTHDVDEAILLADRVAVLTDGRLSYDERVRLSHDEQGRLSHDEQGRLSGPRHRSDPEFAALRARLLAELGVTDDEAESRPGAAPGAAAEIGDA